MLPAELTIILNDSARKSGLHTLISKLLGGIREIGVTLRECGYSTSEVGTQNAFGDHQLDVDVKTDELIFACLRSSSLVHVAASEENPVEIDCGGAGFSVAFDPLDGAFAYMCSLGKIGLRQAPPDSQGLQSI